jgi:hypothetical protein
MRYSDYLHEYEYAVRDSNRKAAAAQLRERGELSGDPMDDYKKIAERALVLSG